MMIKMKEVNIMKKAFAIITLLVALLTSNAADAKFSDEYKAQYPKRVKTQKIITDSGRPTTSTRYKLFSRWLSDGLFELAVMDYNGIKVCTICYGINGNSPREFLNFTWGDGENAHEIQTLSSESKSISFNRFSDFIDARVNPKLLKTATVISVHDSYLHSEHLIYESHKRWKEWKKAIDAAEKIMNER